MNRLILLLFILVCCHGELHSQEKFKPSQLLNDDTLNKVVTQFEYLKHTERIMDGDTLSGFLLDHSKFKFLGNSVGQIEIH